MIQINTQYLDNNLLNEIIDYLRTCLPNEGCGAIIDDCFVPFENESNNPREEYEIISGILEEAFDNTSVQAIIHSHNNAPYLSEKDMINQQEDNIPHIVINFKNASCTHAVMFGDSLEIQPMIGRYFFSGVNDCYTLVRDFVKVTNEIILPNPPRTSYFWERNISFVETYMAENKNNIEEYSYEIPFKEARYGDILLYKISMNDTITHFGIYMDNGKVLHHFANRKSSYFPITFNNKYLYKIYRIKSND